nr:uncharacterized mitochondrial protein AtMg00810-like [Tanacetum cinerariifolium]
MAVDDNNDGDHPETSNTSPPVPLPTQQIPHTVLSIKLPILKKEEYDIWAMKMEHYLSHIDYPIWFQTLLSQLEIHGAGVSYEDANQKFLRSLPSSWSQVALIMRTKLGLDTFTFNDLYNNLSVFERDVKGTTTSSSNTQNVAFVSVENTSSTNDVSTAYSVSSPSVSKSQKEGSSSYTDEVIHSFSNQSSAPQLDYDDLKQINDDDMEQMELKWQVAMNSMRIKKFHKRTGRKLQFNSKDPIGFDKTKVECFNCHKIGHFARDCRAKENQDSRRRDAGYNGNKTRDNGRRPAYQDDSKALVTIDREDIDWSKHVEEDAQNYAMVAYSSSNSGSDNEVKSYSKACEESYARLKTLYDDQRDKLSDASVEITAYTLALKSVEPSTSMPELVKNASKVICEPKVWTDTPIIEEYESDSDNDSVSNDDPHRALKDKGIVDSRCSRHITGNKAHLADYQEFKGGSVAFGGSNERITSKGKIKNGRLDFEDVYYMEELKHYNLFSMFQMCDKKNKVLFTDTDCLVLSSDIMLLDENQVLLRIPRQHSMYSFNLKNIDPFGDLAYLFAKASIDESNKWHRRLGHVNFKKLNKLVKGNLVRSLPSKIFENDHTCVGCQKGKQHKAFWIKREYSNARTPQQNGVAERKNMTLIEAARTIINLINTASTPLNIVGPSRAFNDGELSYPDASKYALLDVPLMPHLEDINASPSERIFTDSSYDDEGVKEDGIFISQDKYAAEIIKKFNFLSMKTASTPIETQKPLVKDKEAADVDVTPKTLHLHVVKRIFRYLKGQPKLGLWYPKVSSSDLEAYSDCKYADVNLDRKSTTRGCQFLGRRLISWKCKKQTIVATSTTEAEYVTAAHYCGQVLWI